MNRSLRLQIILLTVVRVIVNTMHRMVYPFLPTFSRGLGVELDQFSLALTARSLIGLAAPLMTWVANQRGHKVGMLFGLGLFSIGVLLVIGAPGFAAFTAALLLATLGKYTFDPALQAYLGERVPYERRGLAVAVTELGWSLAFIVGIPLMGVLIASAGWSAPFPVLGVLGVAALIGMWLWLPGDSASALRRGTWRNVQAVLSSRAALAGLAFSMFLSAANEMVNMVFGVWMEDSFGLQIAALGAASAVIGISELGGEALVGGLTDRLGKARSAGIGIALNCVAVVLLPVLGKNVPGALSGLFLFYITFEFSIVSCIPLMTELLPEARATLMGMNVASFALGRSFSTLVALPIYHGGILANAAAAAVLNLLALWALREISQREKLPPTP